MISWNHPNDFHRLYGVRGAKSYINSNYSANIFYGVFCNRMTKKRVGPGHFRIWNQPFRSGSYSFCPA
jgi:hypothetical protein